MKAVTAAVIWIGLALPAVAQGHGDQKAVVAECDVAGACRCYLSDLTMAEAAVALGTALPADPEAFVLSDSSGALKWSPVTRQELDIVLGADGACPIEVFQEWEPEDGIWDGATVLMAASGPAECSQIAGMAVGMMNSAIGRADVRWGGAFDMEKFYAATGPEPGDDRPRWTRVNRHVVTGQGGGDGMTTAYRAQLLTPKRFLLETLIKGEGCAFDLRTDVARVD